MIESLLPLLLMGAALWAWMDILRAREVAIRAGRELCRRSGVQLLDQSVALSHLRPVRVSGRLTLRRRYGFDISTNGSDRHRGHLDLVGNRMETWSLPLVEHEVRSEVPTAALPPIVRLNITPPVMLVRERNERLDVE